MSFPSLFSSGFNSEAWKELEAGRVLEVEPCSWGRVSPELPPCEFWRMRVSMKQIASALRLVFHCSQRSYVVILTARNAVGASAPTVISSLVTSPAVPPSPPVAVSVVSVTSVARHRVAVLEQRTRSPVHCSVAL